MARPPPPAHRDEPAFVLHAYAYRETSLIVESFTRSHGRVAMVARGARRPRSELRGLLQAFQPLALSWAGAAELKTLVHAEWRGGLPLLGGAALLCGFYANELVLKLLVREDAHASLFDDYAQALSALAADATPAGQAAVLRRFEVQLLAAIGYAMNLTHEAGSDAPIVAAHLYHYAPDAGARMIASHVAEAPDTAPWLVRGATLVALATGHYPDADIASEAKRLMRQVLDHRLEARGMASRRIVRDLIALDERKQEGQA
ncbi:MAG: DNA repair protein RecO [Burkholderiales bacterium]|nr:DNA repair protein RecO [Burkholderiales bacterium]